MDFFVCQCDTIRGLKNHIPIGNIKDQNEAVSKARDIAVGAEKGVTFGLFTQDGVAICGWKVLPDGKLRDEPADIIQDMCGVCSGSFDFAKGQADVLRNARENKQ